MKIGILTISKSEVSYGANLQCYALWEYVKSLNLGECEVVDLKRPCQFGYKTPKHEFSSELNKKNRLIIYSLKQKILALIHVRRKKNFMDFWEYVSFSAPINIDELYEKNLSYDVLISGSDQIWNFDMPFYTEVFFQTFKYNGRKISYASSFGGLETAKKHSYEIRKYLESYYKISVREQDAAQWLENLSGKAVMCCVDPVFLLDVTDWNLISSDCLMGKEKYLFAYSLNYNEEFLENIPKDTDYKIVTYGCKIKLPDIYDIKAAGPKEFVSLIKNAGYIVTDSFHCIAFSLIYKKNFIAVENSVNSKTLSRIENLIAFAGVSECTVKQNELKKGCFKQLDYSNYSKLEKQIECSKKFLQEALHE